MTSELVNQLLLDYTNVVVILDKIHELNKCSKHKNDWIKADKFVTRKVKIIENIYKYYSDYKDVMDNHIIINDELLRMYLHI